VQRLIDAREKTLTDQRTAASSMRTSLDNLVPGNADVQDIKVILVDELDDSNSLDVKGVGEVGVVGVPAAIANAVYHATGKRIRDLPITLDKLLT
jgi:xanthine dehydrogenase YagR molybdenum-binding subunit